MGVVWSCIPSEVKGGTRESLVRLVGGGALSISKGEGLAEEEVGMVLFVGSPAEKMWRGSGGTREDNDHQPCSPKILVPERRDII